jgi:hypothetical protein
VLDKGSVGLITWEAEKKQQTDQRNIDFYLGKEGVLVCVHEVD